MKTGKKYAVVDTSYKKLAVPVEYLAELLERSFLVSTTYDDGKDRISEVADIDKVFLFDGIEIDQAIAESKLKA